MRSTNGSELLVLGSTSVYFPNPCRFPAVLSLRGGFPARAAREHSYDWHVFYYVVTNKTFFLSVQDQDKKLQDLWRTCQKLPPPNFVNFRYVWSASCTFSHRAAAAPACTWVYPQQRPRNSRRWHTRSAVGRGRLAVPGVAGRGLWRVWRGVRTPVGQCLATHHGCHWEKHL